MDTLPTGWMEALALIVNGWLLGLGFWIANWMIDGLRQRIRKRLP